MVVRTCSASLVDTHAAVSVSASRPVFILKCRREKSELQLLTKVLQSQQFNILWNAETDHKSVRHTPKPGSWGADHDVTHDFMQVHVTCCVLVGVFERLRGRSLSCTT